MSSIDRKAHALRREKTMAIPRHLMFVDTETTQTKDKDGNTQQHFRLGWLCYYSRAYGRNKESQEWFYFDTIGSFWDFVFTHCDPKQKLWIIARNMVFDFTVLRGCESLRKEGYKLRFFHNNGVSVIVNVRKGKNSLVFLDSMNWFTESLAKTGDRIGIPKMDIDFETCLKKELIAYCRNDVLIEVENFLLFIKFLEGNAISRLCYTKASTAMAAYLLRHYHTTIYIHNNAEAIKLERDSYKGGRCECFYIGEPDYESYYVVDVNSLYPFVMRNNEYPVKYKHIGYNISVKELTDYIDNYAVVAKVGIDTDEPVYAVKRKLTLFPIGCFTATLCTPELKYALEHNHITKVYDYVIYEQANIFKSYVDTMYALRRDFSSAGVKEYEKICKLLLNSLYGKFGQKAENWVKVGVCPNEPDREELMFYDGSDRVDRLRFLLGEVFKLKSYGEAFNSFPAIASHVSAYARMYLWSLMQLAGHGNYFYGDTDSLIVNDKGMDNLTPVLDDTKLGFMKHEETTHKLIIHGLKDYEKDSKVVIKGIRRNAVKISEGVYRQEQWSSFKGLLHSGDINTYTVKSVTKHLSRKYTKGIVTDSGVVKPIALSEENLYVNQTTKND
ncbi:hypothetical protein ES705_20897 [subsurface metagenome]